MPWHDAKLELVGQPDPGIQRSRVGESATVINVVGTQCSLLIREIVNKRLNHPGTVGDARSDTHHRPRIQFIAVDNDDVAIGGV